MTDGVKYEFTANANKPEGCDWVFVSLSKKMSEEIRKEFQWKEEGWGRMKVTAKIGNSEWKTSIWFDAKHHNVYWFPIKAEIRKREKIEINQTVNVAIWI